ncbi:MAG: hydrogenase expression/formation protein HypE [Lachnospiraceae bacterium]|nr:hydrogenase expression/formation protein HypE [Lachnospiraceae bacterium]
MKIDKTHGAGGVATSGLIDDIFKQAFSNEYLEALSDSAVVPGSGKLALTTDSFVVKPVFFPGGDIGRLAVCGTVNDLLMSGARPQYLTAGYILEEGLEVSDLERIVKSMSETAGEAGITIVTGDTKVVGPIAPKEPGLIINTSGVGFIDDNIAIAPTMIETDDAVIVSGNLGEHHTAILSSRLSVKNNIVSDVAPLNQMVSGLIKAGIRIHAMRDITRGGLATILNELASASGKHIRIEETEIPVSTEVKEFSKLLGLDPLYMGNEGKCVIILPKDDAEKALNIIRGSKYGENAAMIGSVDTEKTGVTLRTAIGGEKVIGPLYGEGLPRIC